ncbi:hypothetical protein R1flu_010317 [Riccia fluitans]|uniref:Uncharacterized protein n=1 Tax=Riccia fluitans TaxID=41844 RepID=A0ABD1Z4T3_9MARC
MWSPGGGEENEIARISLASNLISWPISRSFVEWPIVRDAGQIDWFTTTSSPTSFEELGEQLDSSASFGFLSPLRRNGFAKGSHGIPLFPTGVPVRNWSDEGVARNELNVETEQGSRFQRRAKRRLG